MKIKLSIIILVLFFIFLPLSVNAENDMITISGGIYNDININDVCEYTFSISENEYLSSYDKDF